VNGSIADDFRFDDFTEDHYTELLRAAAARYRFIPFTDFDVAGNVCLWRHDIDFSPHRAARLAAIEADVGVVATYFVNVHSEFCSVLGEMSSRLIRNILAMGHRIGLHFDAGFYAYRTWSRADRDVLFGREKQLLESTFETTVDCYSMHTPTVAPEWRSDDTFVAGMVNAYCDAIRSRFTYVSDSNGIWRHRRLADVLAEQPPRLHVLTHAEWWTPEAMSPRDRISRCIDGRARALHHEYDAFLARCMRPNIGTTPRDE
jgi:hypothetical protein